MVSDEALNTLLDRLGALGRREDQLAILRTWIAALMQAWDAERIDEQRETLGKAWRRLADPRTTRSALAQLRRV